MSTSKSERGGTGMKEKKNRIPRRFWDLDLFELSMAKFVLVEVAKE